MSELTGISLAAPSRPAGKEGKGESSNERDHRLHSSTFLAVPLFCAECKQASRTC